MRKLAIFVFAGALLGLLWVLGFGPDGAAEGPELEASAASERAAEGADPATLERPRLTPEPEASRHEVAVAPALAAPVEPRPAPAPTADAPATGSLRGRVLDLDEAPVKGELEVHVALEQEHFESRLFSGLARDGWYEIGELPPGVVRSVWVGGDEPRGERREVRVEILPGVAAQLDVYVRAGVRVSGTVVQLGEGTPIEGVRVWMDVLTTQGIAATVTDWEGRFDLGGVYVESHVDDEDREWVMVDLNVELDGYSKPATTRYLSPLRDDEHYEFEIELASLGASLAGRTFRSEPGVVEPSATLVAVDSHGWTYSERSIGGLFRFDKLPAGELALAAWSYSDEGGLLHSSIRIDLPADEVTSVDLVLRPARETALEGRVLAPGNDEISLQAIGLSVMPVLEHRGLSAQIPSFSTTGITEPDGSFRVGGVMPGRSWVSLELGRRARSEDLRVFPELMEVEVASGEVLRGLEFRLLPGFWVSGFVEAREAELARLTLELEDPRGEVVASGQPRPDGSFELDPVEPGEYTLVLSEGARRIAEREVAPGLVEEIYFRY